MGLSFLFKKLLGVGIIVGVLAGASGTGEDMLSALFDIVKINAAKTEINQFHKVLMSFYIRETRYPRKDTGELADWFSEHYEMDLKAVETDPWESRYFFLIPDYEITCNGPDMRHLTRDDILQHYPRNVQR